MCQENFRFGQSISSKTSAALQLMRIYRGVGESAQPEAKVLFLGNWTGKSEESVR